MRSELLSNSPAVGDRPPDRQALGGWAAALGLRALAGGAAPVYSSNGRSGCCGERRPSGYGGGERRPASVGRSWRSWPRLRGWRSPRRPFIGICNAWAWSAPVRSDGGRAFRTAKSCDPVTVRAWATSSGREARHPGAVWVAGHLYLYAAMVATRSGSSSPSWMRAERVLCHPAVPLPAALCPDGQWVGVSETLSHQVHRARP